MNHSHGIDTAPTLGFDPENAISTEPNIGGQTIDEMTIKHISMTPWLVSTYPFVNGSTPIQIMTTGIEAQPYFCDMLKQCFAFWSGSHKVKIYIAATIFHYVQLRFYLADESGSNYGDLFTRVVDFQGSTEVEFTIPYMAQNVMTGSINTGSAIFSLYCAIDSWSQNSTTNDTPITLVVYKAAADDFRVEVPMDVYYQVTSNPRVDFNKPFEPFHPSFVGYGQSKMLIGEETLTIRDYIHRYLPQNGLATGYNAIHVNKVATTSGTQVKGVDIFQPWFRFWRGSVRYRFVYDQPPTHYGSVAQGFDTGTPKGGNTLMLGTTTMNPTVNALECSVPYYSQNLFEVIGTTALRERYLYCSFTNGVTQFKAMGDDFSYHWLVAPASGSIVPNNWQTSTTIGTAGWMNAQT